MSVISWQYHLYHVTWRIHMGFKQDSRPNVHEKNWYADKLRVKVLRSCIIHQVSSLCAGSQSNLNPNDYFLFNSSSAESPLKFPTRTVYLYSEAAWWDLYCVNLHNLPTIWKATVTLFSYTQAMPMTCLIGAVICTHFFNSKVELEKYSKCCFFQLCVPFSGFQWRFMFVRLFNFSKHTMHGVQLNQRNQSHQLINLNIWQKDTNDQIS